MNNLSRCQICQREVPDEYMEEHHLVPKVKGGKEKIDVCCPCGDQLHLLFTIRELKELYNSLEALLANERVQKWIKFVRKQKGFHVCMKRKK